MYFVSVDLNDVEFGSDAIASLQTAATNIPRAMTDSTSTLTSQSSHNDDPEAEQLSRKSIKLKEEYIVQLEGFFQQLQRLCRETVPSLKLQYSFSSLQTLSHTFQVIQNELQESSGAHGASADDLTDFLVVVLCNCDLDLVKRLYTSIQLMRDFMQERHESGPYGYALMQFTMGLMFLQERIVMQRRLVTHHLEAQLLM